VELRTYAKIIWRYIWLLIVIVGIVAAYSGYQYYKLRKTPGALTAYNSNISLQIGLEATTQGDANPSDNETVASVLADTLVSGPILTSNEFSTAISQQIGLDMGEIQQRYGANADLGNWQTPSAIAGALSATRTDSLVTISVNWSTAAGAWAITNAIGEVSTARIGQYLGYVIATNSTRPSTGSYAQPEVSARIISAASAPGTVPGSSTSKVTVLVLLVVIALAIAIALAFLLDYLDDRLRTKEDVLDLFPWPVYGEVPHAPAPGHLSNARGESIV
jgi:hypothetical protein